MLLVSARLKPAIIYWKLLNHSKRFLVKTSKLFSLCTLRAATLHSTFAEEGSFFNFWSASVLWEVRSVNFAPVAVCAKSLIHEICLISSGVPEQPPPPARANIWADEPFQAPRWHLLHLCWGKMESRCMEMILGWGIVFVIYHRLLSQEISNIQYLDIFHQHN